MSEDTGDYSVHLALTGDEMEHQAGLPLDGETYLNFSDDRIQEQNDDLVVSAAVDPSALETAGHEAAVEAEASELMGGNSEGGVIRADVVDDLDWQDKVKEIARSALSEALDPSHATGLSTVPVVAFNSLIGSTLLADPHVPSQEETWAATLGHGGYGSLMDLEITRSSPPEDLNHHAFITPNLIFATQPSDPQADSEEHRDTSDVAKEGNKEDDEKKRQDKQPSMPMGPPSSTPDKQSSNKKQSPSSTSSTSTVQATTSAPSSQQTRKSSRARKPSALATLSEEYLQAITVPTNQPLVPERVTRSKKVYCFCQQPDDGEVMIQCDNCRQWFHGACVNITDEDAERMDLSNEKFFCGTCREKLEAQAKSTGSKTGLYLSLSNARDCALPTCVNEARPTSDYCSEECAIKGIELEASQLVSSGSPLPSPSTPTVATAPKPAAAAAAAATSKSAVVKKAATRVKAPESPKVEQDTIRMTVAKGLTDSLLIMVEAANNSNKDKDKTSDGEPAVDAEREKARQLALAIEKELYIFTATPGQAGVGKDYKAKYRSLFFNLKDKSNDSLRKRVLSGELAPHDLVRLTPEELANPLLQSIAEEVRKRSIHDSVLTPEQQSFIKKNHKGEVTYVMPEMEDGSSRAQEEQATIGGKDEEDRESKGSSEKDSEEDDTALQAGGTTSGGIKPTPPGSPIMEEYSLDKLLAKIPSSKRSRDSVLTGDLTNREKRARLLEGSSGSTSTRYSRGSRRESHDNQDASSYLPREPSPYSPSPSPQGSPLLRSTTPPDSPPAFFLEEIEQMVQRKRSRIDKDGNDLLPVWQGTLSMRDVGSVSVRAVQVGGRPTIPGRYARPFFEMLAPGWMDLLTRAISIDGRIPVEVVNDYVQQQMQSPTKDVLLIEFLVDEETRDPAIERRKSEFRKLFDYFHEKRRNGVVPHKGKRVKDMYLVPIAAGQTLPPYFETLLDSARGEIEADCLFGVLIVNKSNDENRHHRHGQQHPSSGGGSRKEHHGGNSSSHNVSSSHGHARNEHRSSNATRHENSGNGQGVSVHNEQPPSAFVPPSATSIPPLAPSPPVPMVPPSIATVVTSASVPAVAATTVAPPAAPMRPMPSLNELQGLVNQLFGPQTSKPISGAASQPPALSQPSYQAASGLMPRPPAPSYTPVSGASGTTVATAAVSSPTPESSNGPTAAAAAVTAQLNETNAAALLANLPPGFLEQFKKQAPTATPQPPPQQRPPQASSVGSVAGGTPPSMPPSMPPMPPGMPFVPGMPLPPFPGPGFDPMRLPIPPPPPPHGFPPLPPFPPGAVPPPLPPHLAMMGAVRPPMPGGRGGGGPPVGGHGHQGPQGTGRAPDNLPPRPPLQYQQLPRNIHGGGGSSVSTSPTHHDPRYQLPSSGPNRSGDRDRPPKRAGPDHEPYRRNNGSEGGGSSGSHGPQRKRQWS